MAIQKHSTPGVYLQEIDQSDILSPAGTSTGAIVIRSQKGPINRPVLVTSDKDIIETFGKPIFTSGAGSVGSLQAATTAGIPDTGYGIYSALEFLKESDALYIGRICDSTDLYSGLYFKTSTYDYTLSGSCTSATSAAGISSIPFVNGNQFDTNVNITSIESGAIMTSFDFLIASLYPGADGNNLAVSLETYSSACDWYYSYDGFPISGTIGEATQVIGVKTVRIDVFVKDTSQSWNAIKTDLATKQASSVTSAYNLRQLLTPAETFYGTLVDQVDGNGVQMKLSTVVNGNSNYIYVKIGTTTGFSKYGTGLNLANTSLGFLKYYDLMPLGGGTMSTKTVGLGDVTADLGNITNAWDLFANRELLPNINILLNPDWNTTVKQKIAYIAASRMDCIGTGQTGDPDDTTIANIKAQEAYGYSNPSYMALYEGWDKVYDQYNDKFFYLPKSVFGAVLMARTDRVANTWDAPAGRNRGIIPSFDQKIMLTDAQIGQLYDANINTSKNSVGVGSWMCGQKTAQLKKSALDRINIRRCLLYIENSIQPMLEPFLFELNTDRVRQRVTSLITNFLDDIMGAGGLTGRKVVCDATNNTQTVIDNNTLAVDIYVQPSRTIEFIQLRVVVMNSGVTISEI